MKIDIEDGVKAGGAVVGAVAGSLGLGLCGFALYLFWYLPWNGPVEFTWDYIFQRACMLVGAAWGAVIGWIVAKNGLNDTP